VLGETSRSQSKDILHLEIKKRTGIGAGTLQGGARSKRQIYGSSNTKKKISNKGKEKKILVPVVSHKGRSRLRKRKKIPFCDELQRRRERRPYRSPKNTHSNTETVSTYKGGGRLSRTKKTGQLLQKVYMRAGTPTRRNLLH